MAQLIEIASKAKKPGPTSMKELFAPVQEGINKVVFGGERAKIDEYTEYLPVMNQAVKVLSWPLMVWNQHLVTRISDRQC